MCNGNGPCREFSCPTPTLGNLNNKTGLKAFQNYSGWSKCCSCFISRETQKLPKNEVAAVIYWPLQTTALQCQSHKTKGSHKTSTSRAQSRNHRQVGPDLGRTEAQHTECVNARHACDCFSLWHFNEKKRENVKALR